MKTAADFAAERLALFEELRLDPQGLSWCERHARLTDELVLSVVPADAPLAVLATGGYGRRELSPFSDADLTIVPTEDAGPGLDDVVRRLFREMHDAFAAYGMPLGYAYRLVSDAAGLDAKTRTGLLDVRFLAGDPRPLRPLIDALRESFSAGEFALAKIRERERAWARTNDTPLVVEPDLKEGAGGLRDFHAANWLRAARGEQPKPPGREFDAVLRARNVLHAVAGRAQDLFSRSRHGEVAALCGVSPESLVADLTGARCGLSKEYARAMDRLREARYELSPGVFAARGEIRLSPDAPAGIAALGVSIGVQLGLTVGDFPAVPASFEGGPEAARAISNGSGTVRALDEAGLLERLLPELTAVRTRLPDDVVHVYTVMEHSIRAMIALEDLDDDGFLGTLWRGLPDREPLMLAALLHDVGKTDGDEGHAERGAAVVEAIGQRWRLAAPDLADLAWLVRKHLTMTRFVRTRDLDRPESIAEFARIVGTPERLVMLTLLTYADVSAVAPGVWTPALATFLRQLYERTAARLEADQPPSPDLETYRRRIVRRLNQDPVDEAATARFVASMPADYLASTPTELIALHFAYAARAREGEPTVEAHPRPDLGATELTVVCADSPGLLSRLLGVLYAHDLSILAIRAGTADAVALDRFVAGYGGGPIPAATLKRVSEALRAVAKEERDTDEVLRARGLDPLRRQSFLRWSFTPGTPGVLEIRAPKGRGMPYRVARQLAAHEWNVVSARVGQWAGNAAATFYVIGPNGAALTREDAAAAFTDE